MRDRYFPNESSAKADHQKRSKILRGGEVPQLSACALAKEVRMLNLVLGWMVIVLPFLGSLWLAFVAERLTKDVKLKTQVVVFGVIVSALTWWQISRADKQAEVDRNNAVVETSKNVSASVSETVTNALAAQYQHTIDGLNQEIAELKGELQNQGKKVDVIGRSNIVTGKSPIKVEVANGNLPATLPTPTIEGLSVISQEPLSSSPHPDAPYGIRVVVSTKTPMQPTKFGLEFDNEVLYGEIQTGSNFSGVVLSADGRVNDKAKLPEKNSWAWRVDEPKFLPETPWIVRLYGKAPLKITRIVMGH
jgi:hypothetical protein